MTHALRQAPCLLSLLAAAFAMGGEFSVIDFGAEPNDDAGDASAFTQAVESAQPGDSIVMPEGTFLIDATVKLKSGIRLTGAGMEKTHLHYAGQRPHCFLRINEAKEIELSQFTIDGLNQPGAQQGIVATRSQRISIHHLRIQNFVDTGSFGPHGILCSRTSHSTVSDNIIQNMAPEDPWGAGMRFGEPCAGNLIERNTIHNTGRGGIFTNNGAGDAVIRRNVITGSHGIAFAIEVHSGSVRTVVEDNVVDHGLSIVSANCAVRRNVVLDSTGTWGSYGIEGGGGPDGVVTDNIINYGQKQGISLSGPQRRMLWARNTFMHCNTWGMQIQGPRKGEKIHSLYFYRNRFSYVKRGHPAAQYPGHDGHAIRFNDRAEHITFDSNVISDNAGLAIQITSGNDVNHLAFIDNVITGNQAGVINRYPGDTLRWEGNLVSGPSGGIDPETQGEPGQPPTAAMQAPSEARVGEPVEFRGTASPGTAPIEHVLWDFGAGVPATTAEATFAYDTPGRYRVSLIVWDQEGRGSRPAEHIIRVTGP